MEWTGQTETWTALKLTKIASIDYYLILTGPVNPALIIKDTAMQQTGARYIFRDRQSLTQETRERVILCHVKRESELIHLASGAVKRVKRQAD